MVKKKVLVTGGIGYIGSHTVVELLTAGYDVVIVDNLSNSDREVLDGIEKITGKRPVFEEFDLSDKSRMENLFQEKQPIGSVVHFAASKSVGESVKKPLLYYRNNILSLVNLLEVMDQFGTATLVFSSSCTVYGQPEKLPVNEQAPIQEASSPYGYTKQISERIIRDSVAVLKDLKCISLRYFNPIGAHPSALIGELPRGLPENLVPYITQTAIGLREYLRVFGNDYMTPDGSCVRDYLHVVDLAKAHLAALKRLEEDRQKNNYEVFNLGTGKGVSVFEAIQAFERVSGKKLNYKLYPRRSGDIEKIWADPTLANTELGWKARSSLEVAMETAWNWEVYYRKNKSGI